MALLLLGALADAITTYRVVRAYGAETEVHPVQRIVFAVFGVTAGVPVAKTIQLLFVVPVACWWRPWCRWLRLACGILHSFAALSNYSGWL